MDFITQFEKYSNHQLLKIINSPNDYKPNAIEAAKTIISNRQLSDEEIEEFNTEYQELREKTTKDKPTELYKNVFDFVNPLKGGALIPEKVIRIITVVLCGIFLLQVYREYEITFSFFESFKDDWYMIFSALPILIFATAITLFYLKKKIGWILLAAYLIHSVISTVWMHVMFVGVTPTGVEALDVISSFYISPIAQITRILSFIFHVGIIWVICTKSIRSAYPISTRTMVYTISITTLAMVLIMAYFVIRNHTV